ncbi:Polyamine-modulated factor 1, partial [Stegodyphus mimosarum]
MAESLPTTEKSSKEQNYSSGTAKSVNESSINIDSEPVIFTEERLKRHFERAVSLTLQKYISSITFSLFRKMYPEIHQKCPEELHDIYNQFADELKPGIQEDLNPLFEKTNIGALLTDLENMIQMQADNGPSWRPSGNPEEDLRDHICEEKKKHKKALQYYLSTMIAQKEALEEEMSQNDKEISNLQECMRAHHQKVKEAMSTLDQSMLSQIQDRILAIKGKRAVEKE